MAGPTRETPSGDENDHPRDSRVTSPTGPPRTRRGYAAQGGTILGVSRRMIQAHRLFTARFEGLTPVVKKVWGKGTEVSYEALPESPTRSPTRSPSKSPLKASKPQTPNTMKTGRRLKRRSNNKSDDEDDADYTSATSLVKAESPRKTKKAKVSPTKATTEQEEYEKSEQDEAIKITLSEALRLLPKENLENLVRKSVEDQVVLAPTDITNELAESGVLANEDEDENADIDI
ncbi:hypothetical protein HDU85_006175 [Gaertneriomyces sp. JEL0708]|nr:hypothetical protein HDU85_006175 [Gaertneriomyces sp. JEL0708]